MSIKTLLIAGFLMVAMLAPLAEVQPTVVAVASGRDANVEANVNTAAIGDTHVSKGTHVAGENRKFVAEQAPHKKKKNFMHKMRDTATEQLQKLLGSKPDHNRNP